MKRFEFYERVAEMEIGGQVFRVPVNMDTIFKVQKFALETQEKAKTLPETPEGTREAVKFMSQNLNQLLGDGATESIFKGRELDLFDLSDILRFVSEEISNVDSFRRGRQNKQRHSKSKRKI